MAVQRFTTTRLSGLQAAGRIQDLQHAVVAPFLERELGAPYGRLLADFEMESADVRAWYVEADMAPVRIGDLPPARQAALRETLAAMLARIAALAETMEHESPQRAHVARVLATAIVVPEEDVWALGDAPLLVNWGFRRRDVVVAPPAAILERPPREPAATTSAAGPATTPGADARKSNGDQRSADVPERSRPASSELGKSWPKLTRRHLDGLRLPLWALFAVLVLACLWQLVPACTEWPILSSFETCRSMTWLGARHRRLIAELDGEKARLAQCSAPRAEAPPQAVLDAAAGVPRLGSSRQRDVVIAWSSRAQLELVFACPAGPTSFTGGVGTEACGARIVAEANTPQGETTETPVDRAVLAQPPPRGLKIGVTLVGYNGLPEGTPVPFVILRRTGSMIVWGQGRLDRVGETYYVTIDNDF